MGIESNIPFRGWYRVDAQLTAGPYPSTAEPSAARDRLAALLESGVDSIIDLTELRECARYGMSADGYADMLDDVARAAGRKVTRVRMGFPDMSVPDPELMISILDAIDAARARGHAVYVHCLGGVGRTGAVVGCWLMRHGVATRHDVLDRLDALRGHRPGLDLESPQTEAQRAMVTGWERGR